MGLGVREPALGTARSDIGLGWKRDTITGAIPPAFPACIAPLASKRDESVHDFDGGP